MNRGWDSHCHLNLDPLFEDASALLERARTVGVDGCLVPSFGPSEWARQERLAKLDGVVNALGIHPWCVPGSDSDALLQTLEEGFSTLPARWGEKLKAVGEFGLDRSTPELKACFEFQKVVFTRHLVWANTLSLPVICHLVSRCHGAAQTLLAEHPPQKGGVVHSFSGPRELIDVYRKFGLYFSYSGNLLRGQKARDALRATPSDRLLFETDGPDGPEVGPSPLSPCSLPAVIQAASEILDKSPDWCWQVHRDNTRRLFDIP